MRTALILLLLLAIAAIPGSLLPQKSVSIENVQGYARANPELATWLDRLWLFDVYASPWFSAVYLLLFISLVGCLVPRLRQHIGNLIATPPDAPRRFERLPHSVTGLAVNATPAEAAASFRDKLRKQRWRTAVRTHDDGTVTVSAEKGYVKETGNLVFHFALLALLVGVALGSWYGWHGNRLIVAGAENGFCNTMQQYDEAGLGAGVGAADLPPFCVTLEDFHAEYLDNGQPIQYTADVSYVDGRTGPETPYRLEVNSPLRLDGGTVYLLGHGYAPIVRYTDRYGVTQTKAVPFLPEDGMLTSSGVVKFPDANVDPSGKVPADTNTQVAFAGVYLPTMSDHVDGRLSVFPAERNPRLQLSAYQGNLGLNSGKPQSVYELDQRQIDNGALKLVGQSLALKVGESMTLPDGTKVEFLGTRQWITVSVRSDPGEQIVLFGAVALLVGLMVSLSGKRRRVWARVAAGDDGRSLISLGGLARSEYPGFADEFAKVATLTGADPDEPRQPVAVAQKGH
jgi:cytochrome c biogenesis protein